MFVKERERLIDEVLVELCRMSYSMLRDMPIRMRRCRKRKSR